MVGNDREKSSDNQWYNNSLQYLFLDMQEMGLTACLIAYTVLPANRDKYFKN
jgi:hypothetical protein